MACLRTLPKNYEFLAVSSEGHTRIRFFVSNTRCPITRTTAHSLQNKIDQMTTKQPTHIPQIQTQNPRNPILSDQRRKATFLGSGQAQHAPLRAKQSDFTPTSVDSKSSGQRPIHRWTSLSSGLCCPVPGRLTGSSIFLHEKSRKRSGQVSLRLLVTGTP